MTLSAISVTDTQNRNPGRDEAPAYALDASHSHVGFSVRHMMISNVRGEFTRLTGNVTYDPNRPEATRIDVAIDVDSINTREEKRDAHLKSADFFDVANFPHITFRSKSSRRTKDGLEVTGDLTIHGTTREVKLAVEDVTAEFADPFGGRRVGASARTKVRRSDFNMKWNAALEAGGVLVGDEIAIQIEVELVRQ
jgi:polyisoprenoid-binding protein YceI